MSLSKLKSNEKNISDQEDISPLTEQEWADELANALGDLLALATIKLLGEGFATQILVKGTELWYPGKDVEKTSRLLNTRRVHRLIDKKWITREAQASEKTHWRMTQLSRTFLKSLW